MPPLAEPFSKILTFNPCFRSLVYISTLSSFLNGLAYLFIKVKEPNPAPTRRTSNSTIGSSTEPMFTELIFNDLDEVKKVFCDGRFCEESLNRFIAFKEQQISV
jgi:hypothetical protein